MYYAYDELLRQFKSFQKEKAPNSWHQSYYVLEQYVFPWFLEVKKANNVNDWHLLYREFFDYVNNDVRTTRGRVPSVSVKNKILKSVNSFMTFLKAYSKIDPDAAPKISVIPEYLVKRRGIESIISQGEADKIHAKLSGISQDSADVFLLLFNTGQRLNEGLSLRKRDLFAGEIENSALAEELNRHGIKYYVSLSFSFIG